MTETQDVYSSISDVSISVVSRRQIELFHRNAIVPESFCANVLYDKRVKRYHCFAARKYCLQNQSTLFFCNVESGVAVIKGVSVVFSS